MLQSEPILKEGKAFNFDKMKDSHQIENPSVPDYATLPQTLGDLEAEQLREEPNPYGLCLTAEDLMVDAADRDTSMKVSRSLATESKSVVTEENTVLQKLLRRWRYFDSGDENFHLGHAVNSTATKQRKPCYVCGDIQHTGKKCRKRRTCYTCKERGHIAEDCPKSNLEFDICLRCGESGHSLFSCNNDYSPGDLKHIQCYVCNELGHVCCGSYIDVNPATPSCYNCGESGHAGLQCTKPHLEKCSSQPPSICYKCGEEGHVARRCINNQKGEQLNPMASQHGDDKSTMLESAESNNGGVGQSRRMARKGRPYRYSRARKQKIKGLSHYVVGE